MHDIFDFDVLNIAVITSVADIMTPSRLIE